MIHYCVSYKSYEVTKSVGSIIGRSFPLVGSRQQSNCFLFLSFPLSSIPTYRVAVAVVLLDEPPRRAVDSDGAPRLQRRRHPRAVAAHAVPREEHAPPVRARQRAAQRQAITAAITT